MLQRAIVFRYSLLLAVLLLAAAVRLYHIQLQSIWFDEGWSAYAAGQPTLRAVIEAEPTNPPLYYLLLHIAVRGFGDSPFALRYFSLLLGLLTVPLTYQLARRLFDARAGLWAAFLVAFNPLLWWASQEARMYTLLAVVVLVAGLAFHQLLKRPTRSAWIALLGAELAALYSHNTGPVIALWLNAAALLAWFAPYLKSLFQKIRSFSSPPSPSPMLGEGDQTAQKSPLSMQWEGDVGEGIRPHHWLAGQLLVALLWSPWFVSRFLLLSEANSAVTAAPVLSADFFSRIWQALWAGSWLMVGRESTINVLSVILFVVALIIIPWRKSAARWLIAHVIILTGGLLLGLLVLGNEIHGRYLVMIVPLLLVAVGGGIGAVGIRYIVSLPLAAIFLFTFAVSIHFNTTNPAYQHDDVRGMVRYYADNLTANDTVLAWSYADRYDLSYYWDRLGVKAKRVTLPESADLDAVLSLLPENGDVALNVWYTQRADYRGMMNCILSHGTINPPEEYTVYGMSDLLYRSPSLDLPQLRPFEAVSDPARITAMGAIPDTTADKALCLPLQLTLSRDLDVELKSLIVIHNPPGWEIARADAVFADAAQRTTSQLSEGSVLTAYPLLRLPVGTPTGDYPVFLRLYDETATPSGYDLAPSLGERASKDLPLGVWSVVRGADWSQVNRQTDLPIPVDVPVSDDLRLLAHDQTGGTLRNGDPLRLTLLWQGRGVLPDLTLAGNGWQMTVPPQNDSSEGVTLDWREAAVPADAALGEAELRLPDGTVLARYTIEVVPALYEPPAFDTAMDADFPGVGTLVGFTLHGASFDRSQPVPVTLVWKADQPTETTYTVFVQLVNVEGRVIAQSDSLPANGQRPTTGWRSGEYIVDDHTLTFHDDAAPGSARLITGLYDASTGQRLTFAPGQDFVTLAENITIR